MGGTYILILHALSDQEVGIGKLGIFNLCKGFYAYVGSAFGAGGLAARLKHHFGSSARPHWHIDYLRGFMQIKEVWLSTDKSKHEHEWAGILSMQEGITIPVMRFGSSDCHCNSHLFNFPQQPSVEQFRTQIRCHQSMAQIQCVRPASA